MRLKVLVGILVMMCAGLLKAQVAQSAFQINWTTLKPAYTDFVGKTSSRGMRMGFTKFISERWGWGVEGGYSVLDDYVPRQTYEYPGGSITTDIFNYMYYLTLAGNGQYYFKTSGAIIPYASLAAGVAFTEYTIFYNVYSDSDNNTSFLIRPEMGIYCRFNKFSGTGLKAAIGYDYATNKSDYFELDNFSALSFQIGLVLFGR